MVSSSSSRQEFATSTVKFLRDRKFDGLDLDWEYPANRGSPAGDKQKFGELLKVYINIKCKACVNKNGIRQSWFSRPDFSFLSPLFSQTCLKYYKE
jgi:chitinase